MKPRVSQVVDATLFLMACGAIALAIMIAGAQADVLQVNIPGCSNLTVTATGQIVTVGCSGVTPPPPTSVTVPNVVGHTHVDAVNALQSATLSVGAVSTQSSGSVPSGSVVSQNPGAGTSALPGTSVALVESTGSGAWSGTCPGFTNTRLLVENWAAPARLFTRDYGGFGADDIVVVQITTGTQASTGNTLRIAAAEWQDPGSQRIAALSDKPCDFVGLPGLGSTVPGNLSPTINFTVVTPYAPFPGYYPILGIPNKTYYFNIKNTPGQCNTPTCNIAVDLVKNGNP